MLLNIHSGSIAEWIERILANHIQLSMSDSLPCPAEWRPNNLVSIGKAVRDVNTCSKDIYDFHKIPQSFRNLRQTGEIDTSQENMSACFRCPLPQPSGFSALEGRKNQIACAEVRPGTSRCRAGKEAKGPRVRVSRLGGFLVPVLRSRHGAPS